MLSLSGMPWTSTFCPQWDGNCIRSSSFSLPVFPKRCGVKDCSGVSTLLLPSVRAGHLRLFLWMLKRGWPLTCLREAEMCRRACAEPLRQHRKGHSKLGRAPYCFISGRHWGPMVTSNRNLLLPHGLPIDKCQRKLEQSLQKSKASKSGLQQGTPCSPCRCEWPQLRKDTEGSRILLMNKSHNSLISSRKKKLIFVVVIRVIEVFPKDPQHGFNLAEFC